MKRATGFVKLLATYALGSITLPPCSTTDLLDKRREGYRHAVHAGSKTRADYV